MGTPPQENCSLLDSHKDVRFSEKVETVETPESYGPTPGPSRISEEEVLPAEHTVQPHVPIVEALLQQPMRVPAGQDRKSCRWTAAVFEGTLRF